MGGEHPGASLLLLPTCDTRTSISSPQHLGLLTRSSAGFPQDTGEREATYKGLEAGDLERTAEAPRSPHLCFLHVMAHPRDS